MSPIRGFTQWVQEGDKQGGAGGEQPPWSLWAESAGPASPGEAASEGAVVEDSRHRGGTGPGQH